MDDAPAYVLADPSAPDFNEPRAIRHGIVQSLITAVGRNPEHAQPRDWYFAVVFFLRGILGQRMADTRRVMQQRRVYYLSLEYLPGQILPKVLIDLGLVDAMRDALTELNVDFDLICSLEVDAALGNGGLGRLAACILDSLATHVYPGFGYGIRYEFGMFTQAIEHGRQVEHPDSWLRHGDPWQFLQSSVSCSVGFNGRLHRTLNAGGEEVVQWVDADRVAAVAYDLPMTGYQSGAVLHLRLWAAQASQDFDLRYFNEGNYIEAVRDKTMSETLSKVLYPNDSTTMGQELRLKQEYFFVSASLQDILRRHFKVHPTLDNLPELITIQLNDTHPSLAIPELMRLLVDEHKYPWARAWEMVTAIFCYTNHTLLPEALETWPIALFERMLPRHLDIIYRINHEHLTRVQEVFPGELDKLGQLSLISDSNRRIRMAHLAVVGSTKVNGVSELQTRLLRDEVFPGFKKLTPDKFVAVTNGVTPRQWLLRANPGLADLITSRIGPRWATHLEELIKLVPHADDPEFRAAFGRIKHANKERMAKLIRDRVGVVAEPSTMFDIQVKRIHEYKRQLLNLFQVITRYRRIKEGHKPQAPRTVIIGGKAAPGYDMAKRIIHLIGDVAAVVNDDPESRDWLKLVFVPDYKVSLAEVIIPSADLAQHISTAGSEASGTSNMKFAMNGALTLGTLDGANIEIRDAVGADNIFVFGLKTAEVTELRARGYNPWAYYEADAELKACLDMIGDGAFSPDDPGRHVLVRDALLGGGDHYMLLADYRSYVDTQAEIDRLFNDTDEWARRAILNVAHMGRFSIDRTVRDYAEKIWRIAPFRQ
jgi:starch phosphorylase